MEELKGKVAVVTGAARGIGLALARRACQEGMKVVLADIDKIALGRAEQDLRSTGAQLLAERVDVSDPASVEHLARSTYGAFGAVHLLCNNAGIGTIEDVADRMWRVPRRNWEKTISVNLWGVINGCLSFIPRMIEQRTEGHILNTASIAGLIRSPLQTVYQLTKHAVVSLSESLSAQLAEEHPSIRVSVLCPFFVATSIAEAAEGSQPRGAGERQRLEGVRAAIAGGSDPNDIAAFTFRGLRNGWFYILPHGDTRERVKARFEAILAAYDEEHSAAVQK